MTIRRIFHGTLLWSILPSKKDSDSDITAVTGDRRLGCSRGQGWQLSAKHPSRVTNRGASVPQPGPSVLTLQDGRSPEPRPPAQLCPGNHHHHHHAAQPRDNRVKSPGHFIIGSLPPLHCYLLAPRAVQRDVLNLEFII